MNSGDTETIHLWEDKHYSNNWDTVVLVQDFLYEFVSFVTVKCHMHEHRHKYCVVLDELLQDAVFDMYGTIVMHFGEFVDPLSIECMQTLRLRKCLGLLKGAHTAWLRRYWTRRRRQTALDKMKKKMECDQACETLVVNARPY